MKYYKNKHNEVYAYENDSFIRDGLTAITDEEMFELTKPSKEQVKANNEHIKQSLIDHATQKIAIFQDAINLGVAKDGDAEKLKQWSKYRVLLSRVDSTQDELELPIEPS